MKWLIIALTFICPLKMYAASDQLLFSNRLFEIFEAAEKGEPRCQCLMGIFFETGIYASQNYSEAIQYYSAAAVQGDSIAHRRLGEMLLHGKGVSQDRICGFAHVLIASHNGDDFTLFERDLLGQTLSEVEIAAATSIAEYWLKDFIPTSLKHSTISYLKDQKNPEFEIRLIIDDSWSLLDSAPIPEVGTYDRIGVAATTEHRKLDAQKHFLETKIKELEARAKDHNHQGFMELLKAMRDSAAAGLVMVEVPPLGILEGYFAVEGWKEMGKQYSLARELHEKIAAEKELLKEIEKKREEENDRWK